MFKCNVMCHHFYLLTNALNCIKLRRLKSTCISILKDTHTCGVCVWCDELRHTRLRSKFHTARHRLRTQNIASNFSEARLILPEDGSQRIRNMSEFLIIF